jgi:plasmid stability protein
MNSAQGEDNAMTQITIPNLDEHTLQGLKQLAWRRGLPLEESLRRLLHDAVQEDLGYWRAKSARRSEARRIVSAEAA